MVLSVGNDPTFLALQASTLTISVKTANWLQRSDLNRCFPTYEDGDVATGLRCIMEPRVRVELTFVAYKATVLPLN